MGYTIFFANGKREEFASDLFVLREVGKDIVQIRLRQPGSEDHVAAQFYTRNIAGWCYYLGREKSDDD
jgi:hypothetical protein